MSVCGGGGGGGGGDMCGRWVSRWVAVCIGSGTEAWC